MRVDTVFVSINARDFEAQSRWWSQLLDRRWDREPMPSCHEWDIAGCVFLQVLDNPQDAGNTVVSLRIESLDAELSRLRDAGVEIADAQSVDGFATLRFVEFRDPEGNRVGLLEGR